MSEQNPDQPPEQSSGQPTGQPSDEPSGQPPGEQSATEPTWQYDDLYAQPQQPAYPRTPAAPAPGQPITQPTTQPTAVASPPRARPTTATVAGLLIGALAVGGIAGVTGAAGVVALDHRGDNSQTTVSPVINDDKDSDGVDGASAGSVEQVASDVLPSVVKINVTGTQGSGSGSGIIISSDGEILTNNHVASIAAGQGQMTVNFNDGNSAKATIVGTDPITDLAVIKAEGVQGLTPAKLNTSDNLAVGENVVAIGSPFGLEATVTSGIISALNRPVSVSGDSEGTDTTYPAIQTDAAINPGNSGGPLVNLQGEVIGIDSSIRTASDSELGGQGGSIGLGFAIPIKNVMPVVDQLRKGETPTHAKLGVSVGDAAKDDGLITGASIQSVAAGSAAEKAGIKAGDIVTKVDDIPISNAESLVATIRGMRPGDSVTVTVLRGETSHEIKATLDSDEGEATS
ncbi:MAG: trypsin-like peptidase domain-containing protein [Nocardioidaceae bacterium]